MWREKKTFDYKFIDKRIAEMYQVGGVGIHIHKYLGPSNTGPSSDATQPQIINPTERSIQDLLFMENRDRVYDTTIYNLRGVYTKADQDFDLSQFGLFLSSGTMFVTFPLNDMVRILGRSIMAGDVLELQNLQDDYADISDVPASLKRYYVASDCSWPAEGFSPIWYPHLWRVKLSPLVDSQEYKGLLDSIKAGNVGTPVSSVISQLDTYLNINEAIVEQANNDVPMSGYDNTKLYTTFKGADMPGEGIELTNEDVITPRKGDWDGYLTGDGLAPNGYPVTSGITFPINPGFGDYHLRLDYLPNRLFRYDGVRWNKVEDVQRTSLNRGPENKSLKSSFVNNQQTFVDNDGTVQPELQALSEILKARPS